MSQPQSQPSASPEPMPRPVGNTTAMSSNSLASQSATTPRTVLRSVDGSPNASLSMPQKTQKSSNSVMFIAMGLAVLMLGLGSGYGLAQANAPAGSKISLSNSDKNLKREVESNEITVGTKVGIADESTFRDSGEGMLEKGGIEGEGSHHIVRPGGEDQTLYITSSVIDLDQFVGRKVKVWGETLGAQKAGWLMDVGKLEVLE